MGSSTLLMLHSKSLDRTSGSFENLPLTCIENRIIDSLKKIRGSTLFVLQNRNLDRTKGGYENVFVIDMGHLVRPICYFFE